MSHKSFMSVASLIFAIVAVMHILRLINGWEIMIGDFMVPTWASVVAAIAAGYLAVQGHRYRK